MEAAVSFAIGSKGYVGTGYYSNQDLYLNDFWEYDGSASVGFDEISTEENQLIIYPNPISSSATLQFNTQLKNAEVVIYNIQGKEMLRKKLTGDKMEIERGSLVSGVYFVRVRSEERQWVEKVVVE